MNSKDIFILYDQEDSINSFLLKLILNEKQIPFKSFTVNFDQLPKHIKEAAYEKRFPIIQDRDLVLNETHFIIDYLENRYPSPNLFPFMPDEKANYHSICGKIREELFTEIDLLNQYKEVEAVKRFLKNISELNEVFNECSYFLSNEYSILDCYLVAALHFAAINDIQIESSYKLLNIYKSNCFKRSNYIKSLNCF